MYYNLQQKQKRKVWRWDWWRGDQSALRPREQHRPPPPPRPPRPRRRPDARGRGRGYARTYISLGENCHPREYIKHGLNISKRMGYLTCPFDLCVTSFDALYKCLDTDFKYFFDELRLIDGSNSAGNRENCGAGGKNITNKYGIVFNHEGSTHSHLFKEGKNDDFFYIRNNFAQFRARYINRINNFNNYIKHSKQVTFIVYKSNKNKRFPILQQMLKNKYKHLDIDYIYL